MHEAVVCKELRKYVAEDSHMRHDPYHVQGLICFCVKDGISFKVRFRTRDTPCRVGSVKPLVRLLTDLDYES